MAHSIGLESNDKTRAIHPIFWFIDIQLHMVKDDGSCLVSNKKEIGEEREVNVMIYQGRRPPLFKLFGFHIFLQL